MTAGTGVETLNVLVRYTMSRETAETVKSRFEGMSARGEGVSYLDCVLFDAALDVLGLEQSYYGIPDDEWRELVRQREAAANRYAAVRTVDVTAEWEAQPAQPGRHEALVH